MRNPWFLPLIPLGAVAVGVVLIFKQPPWLTQAALGLVGGAILLWAVLGTLWPNRPEHRCPVCGEEALQRLDPDSTTGLRCGACGHVDRLESSWFLAEEEERPLEEIVLRQRGRAPFRGGPARSPAAQPTADPSADPSTVEEPEP